MKFWGDNYSIPPAGNGTVTGIKQQKPYSRGLGMHFENIVKTTDLWSKPEVALACHSVICM